MKVIEKLRGLNEKIALRGTLGFGSMWMCYAFLLYGFLPKWAWFVSVTGATQDGLLYWSNWVQLWSLPLILVGSNLLARATDKMFREIYAKINEMYEWIKVELTDVKQILALLVALVREVHAMHKEMKCRACDGQPTLEIGQ